MSDSSEMPWSDNPNAPKIPYEVYFSEKTSFAGTLIGAILYGIVIILFFQCLDRLLNPTHRRREGIKWGLVAHTVAMFSFATVYTAMTLDILSDCYINNREFPGVDGVLPPGPSGYRFLIYSRAISVVPDFMFLLNNWLADGLLLYRCYVIYAKNHWVIAFPCLVYLTSFGTGVVLIYQSTHLNNIWYSFKPILGIPYFSVSISLNVLLTLIIVTRLILHSRSVGSALGPLVRPSRLYNAIVTILIESSALYALFSLLFIATWATKTRAIGLFLPILAETQVIAPFLIILRIANQSALTSNTLVSHSIHFSGQRNSTGGGGTLPGVYPMSSTDSDIKVPGEPGVRVETTVDLHRDSRTV